jgi:CRISPR-associated protein Csx3
MTSYTINLCEDMLQVGFNNGISAQGDVIVRDAEAQLDRLINSGRLTGGKLIKINGRISLLVSYLLAHKLAHLYSAIAVFDPRLGAYIVTKSDTPDYPLASRIDATTGNVTFAAANLESSATPSFLLNWHRDILKAQLNNEVDGDTPKGVAEGDRIVLDTQIQLQALINTGQLPGGKQPLLINGRSPVLVGFVIACRVAHLYSAVAVFDPKLAGYVVVMSHGQHRVGDILTVKSEHPPARSAIKVAICGFPNTGKTCLHYGVKTALLQIPDVPDAFVISGCPDGEGSWFSETARRDPKLARKLKDEYKTQFTPEFATAKARDISVISNSLLVFDVGGKISPENRTIMSAATHAVILAKSEAEVGEWEAFCRELNLTVVAILYSDFEGTADCLDCESPILKGSVHHLDRTEDVSSRLMVQKLARVLADLTQG